MNTELLHKLNQRPLHPSIQAKLELLKHIKNGDYEQIASVSYALSKVGRTNPEIYGRLSNFVNEHKQQLIEMQKKEKQQFKQPQIVNIDDTFVEGKQWNTDDQVSLSSDDDESNEDSINQMKENMRSIQKQKTVNKSQIKSNQKRELFKELSTLKNDRSLSKKKNIVVGKVQNNSCCEKVKLQTNTIKKNQENKTNIKQYKNSAIQKSKIKKV